MDSRFRGNDERRASDSRNNRANVGNDLVAIIEGISIVNYRVLKNVTLGKLWYASDDQPLTPITTVIGKNGVGKSSLFDAFGFLADCLKLGVEEACDTRGRGGFDRICSQGSGDLIGFTVCYRENPRSHHITYLLGIAKDDSGRPHVLYEILHQQAKEQGSGVFLFMYEGEGLAWKGNTQGKRIDGNELTGPIERALFAWISKELIGDRESEAESIEIQDKRKLSIATLGALKQHPRIASFRQFIEGWYLSYFTPDAAHGLPLAGPQKHLNVHGDNLGNVVQFMEREHPDRFKDVLTQIAEKVPGIDRIDTQRSPDGRLLLRFNDKGFADPFYAQQMSDGTLKIFAYLLMLNDPSPPPFICIEEPENGLYHKLLEVLAAEFRNRATGEKDTPQIFVTTHQPYLVDALKPDEVWILEKGEDGFATISRASDDETVKAMADEGLPLGGLWYSDYFDRR